MLKFVLWAVVVYLLFRLFWSLFGGVIIRWIAVGIFKRVEKEAVRQRNHMAQSMDPDYERELHLSQDVKIKIPRKQKAQPRNNDSGASAVQDVDFEEVH